MIRRGLGIAIIAGAIGAAAAPVASFAPGSCPNDSKLLNGGPTHVSGEGDGTWWGLVQDGMFAAGLTDEADQIAYLNQVFGKNYTSLHDLRDYNIQLVKDLWDTNGNGFVCAFELRGTRKYAGDPYLNFTSFGISDDKMRDVP